MAILTREELSELIRKLTAARAELGSKGQDLDDLASTLGSGTEKLQELVDRGDLDGAEEWAQAFWRDVLEVPIIQERFRGRAPGERPAVIDQGLVQTNEAVEEFNDAVRKIVLFR